MPRRPGDLRAFVFAIALLALVYVVSLLELAPR